MRGVLVAILVGLMASSCALLKPTGKTKKSLVPEGQYVVVTSVVPESEASRVKVKEGDIILTYDGRQISSVTQLNELKSGVKTEKVELVVIRKGKKKSFSMKKGQIGVYLSERRPEIELADDAVVLKGVGKLGWETGMSNSFIGGLVVTADYLGLEKDYAYLMGVSGSAFRIHFHKDWCPSSPDPTVGFDAGTEATKALGFDSEGRFLPETAREGGMAKEATLIAIKESIDEGRPVIAIDLIEIPEWGVIAGYQRGGSELICRTYFDKQQGYSIAEKFPWAIITLKERKSPPSDRENYINGLNIALKVATTDSFGEYYSGTEALRKWIQRLKMDNFADMDSERFETSCLANAWIYTRLADDRTQASVFLDNLTGSFPEISKALTALSDIYTEQVDILKGAAQNAPFPFALAPGETWTGDMRAEEVKALENVLDRELKAVEILKEINTKI